MSYRHYEITCNGELLGFTFIKTLGKLADKNVRGEILFYQRTGIVGNQYLKPENSIVDYFNDGMSDEDINMLLLLKAGINKQKCDKFSIGPFEKAKIAIPPLLKPDESDELKQTSTNLTARRIEVINYDPNEHSVNMESIKEKDIEIYNCLTDYHKAIEDYAHYYNRLKEAVEKRLKQEYSDEELRIGWSKLFYRQERKTIVDMLIFMKYPNSHYVS